MARPSNCTASGRPLNLKLRARWRRVFLGVCHCFFASKSAAGRRHRRLTPIGKAAGRLAGDARGAERARLGKWNQDFWDFKHSVATRVFYMRASQGAMPSRLNSAKTLWTRAEIPSAWEKRAAKTGFWYFPLLKVSVPGTSLLANVFTPGK